MNNSIIALPPPAQKATAMEPHVAIDPNCPQRIAVVAMVDPDGGRVPRSLYLWQSSDGGSSWRCDRVRQPHVDCEGAVDPVVAFAVDGTLLIAGMPMPSEQIEALAHGRRFTRATVPSLEEFMDGVISRESKRDAQAGDDTISAVRMDAEGKHLGGTLIGPSGGGDKPVVAVDCHFGSPFRGAVYVAWMEPVPAGTAYVSRSTDGGRSFDPPIKITPGAPWGCLMVQLAVRPDGSLHVTWVEKFFDLPTSPPRAATAVWHCRSTDGGKSFEDPVAIASHPGMDLVGLSTMAMAPDGTLMIVWGQASALPNDRLIQPRHQLYAVQSSDGKKWSEPWRLCTAVPETTLMGLPAVTSSARNWWILAYLADRESTSVSLLRASHGDTQFTIARELAQRPIAADDIYLGGRYMLAQCSDVVNVGDYVGIAAADSKIAAAFILPATDDPFSEPKCYVSLIDDSVVDV